MVCTRDICVLIVVVVVSDCEDLGAVVRRLRAKMENMVYGE